MASILKFVTKCAIGGGALYITCEEGIWSSSNQGSKALMRVRTTVLPTADEYFDKVKAATDVRSTVATTWNSGVQKAFSFLLIAPEKLGDFSKRGVTYVRNSLR